MTSGVRTFAPWFYRFSVNDIFVIRFCIAFGAIYLIIPFNANQNSMDFVAIDQANLGQHLLRVLEQLNENQYESFYSSRKQKHLFDALELRDNPQWLIASSNILTAMSLCIWKISLRLCRLMRTITHRLKVKSSGDSLNLMRLVSVGFLREKYFFKANLPLS